MKKNITIIGIILVLPLLVYFILTKDEAGYAQKTAVKGQPQIIKFSSNMCLDCKKMGEVVKIVYPRYKDKIALVEIGVQDNNPYVQNQIKKYNITLVPTIIFVSKNGKIKKVEGYMDKNQFENELKILLKD